jgi:hypothetical protein
VNNQTTYQTRQIVQKLHGVVHRQCIVQLLCLLILWRDGVASCYWYQKTAPLDSGAAAGCFVFVIVMPFLFFQLFSLLLVTRIKTKNNNKTETRGKENLTWVTKILCWVTEKWEGDQNKESLVWSF